MLTVVPSVRPNGENKDVLEYLFVVPRDARWSRVWWPPQATAARYLLGMNCTLLSDARSMLELSICVAIFRCRLPVSIFSCLGHGRAEILSRAVAFAALDSRCRTSLSIRLGDGTIKPVSQESNDLHIRGDDKLVCGNVLIQAVVILQGNGHPHSSVDHILSRGLADSYIALPT